MSVCGGERLQAGSCYPGALQIEGGQPGQPGQMRHPRIGHAGAGQVQGGQALQPGKMAQPTVRYLGAGQAASLGDIVGEVLGVTVDRTSVHIGDSALTPLTGGTFATRQLYMSGNAALKVARALRGKLEPIAAELLSCAPEELEFAENRVAVATDASRSITIAELSRAAEDRGVMPFHHDTFIAETGQFDMATGRGRSFPDYTYGAHAVEIEVDEETGQVRILRYVACHDVGRVIDLGRVEGQIQGAVAQLKSVS